MYKIPFHRKILPWLFTIIFLIMAPAVVFYTSGYRWNPKKNAIERNGTLIVDTVPSGASIKLNGKTIPETTPITLQNMAPGSYKIELELKDHHPWSKTLWVEPERVTFASGVYLWPVNEPEYLGQSDATDLFGEANASSAFLIAKSNTNLTSIRLLDGKTSKSDQQIDIKENIEIFEVEWNPINPSQALVHGHTSSTVSVWLINFEDISANKLPPGNYHWQGRELIGYTDEYKLTISRDQTVSRENKAASVKDELNDYKLLELPQSTGLILTKGENAEEGSILPVGSWSFWSISNETIILRDQNKWLWIDTAQNPASISQAYGDWLNAVSVKKNIKYAFKHNNEAWIWQENNPELIYRQSDPLVGVAWHAQGRDLAVAGKNEVIMFNLDSRDGRYKTTLAQFDNLQAITILQDAIYIIGQKQNQQGLWKLDLTAKKQNAIRPLSNLGL
ncbi:MAG TPA: PEGA domain-containing protein [bacterium]|nr:PEGA domain-containing protein [bacterium]